MFLILQCGVINQFVECDLEVRDFLYFIIHSKMNLGLMESGNLDKVNKVMKSRM